jgi:hypothetical protein
MSGLHQIREGRRSSSVKSVCTPQDRLRSKSVLADQHWSLAIWSSCEEGGKYMSRRGIPPSTRDIFQRGKHSRLVFLVTHIYIEHRLTLLVLESQNLQRHIGYQNSPSFNMSSNPTQKIGSPGPSFPSLRRSQHKNQTGLPSQYFKRSKLITGRLSSSPSPYLNSR